MKKRNKAKRWYLAGLSSIILILIGFLAWENSRPAKVYARWFSELDFVDQMFVLEEMNSLNSGMRFRFELGKEDLEKINDYIEDRENRSLLEHFEGNQLVLAKRGGLKWNGGSLKNDVGAPLTPGTLEVEDFKYVKLEKTDERGFLYRRDPISFSWYPRQYLPVDNRDILDFESDNTVAQSFLKWLDLGFQNESIERYYQWIDELLFLGVDVPKINAHEARSGGLHYVLHREEPTPRVKRLYWETYGLVSDMLNRDRTSTIDLDELSEVKTQCEICKDAGSKERPINFCLVCGKKHCHGVTGSEKTNEILLMACSSLSQCRDETVK